MNFSDGLEKEAHKENANIHTYTFATAGYILQLIENND